MNICMKRSDRGFTLVEIMVVISIVVVLLGIVMASMVQARQGSRDKKRITDLANIEFALTLERERTGNYPISLEGGEEIGVTEGSSFDAMTRLLNGNVYRDPLSEGEGSEFNYVYNSDATCSAPGQAVVYATVMEKENGGNFASVCTAVAEASNAYIIILK